MIENIPLLRTLPLFQGIDAEDIPALLRCLHAQEKYYEQAQFMLDPIARLPYIVVILAGSMVLMQEDLHGNRMIVGDLRLGDFLGESLQGALHSRLPISLAMEPRTKLLLLDPQATLKTSAKAATAPQALI